jgi:hypothetical protein
MRLNAEELDSLLKLDLEAAGFYPDPDDSVNAIRNIPWDESDWERVKRRIASASLVKSLTKKYHQDETDDARDALALDVFIKCNEACRSYGGLHPQTVEEKMIVAEMKNIIYDFFNPCPGFVPVTKIDDFTLFRDRELHLLNLSDIADRFGFGGGANIGASSTDSYTKYCNSDMSFTDPALLVLYKHAISGLSLFPAIERFREANYMTKEVQGNKLSFVPKSVSISRTICTEPVCNMLFQKGIGILMEERLAEFFNIDFARQPYRNAAMARRGSITGRFGTIDLTSASDTISLRLIEELLPPEPRNWLLKARSPKTILPDGTLIELHMISSMGNAFTFPLQTLIFSALIEAVYRVFDLKPRRGEDRNYSVFGDDIIVEALVYERVIRMLELLGFTPNRLKSFNEGPFRESCGNDYYHGYNVRGVYLKRLLTHGDYYVAINRLNKWSSLHRIPLIGLITKLSQGCGNLLVPYHESDDAGIKVPFRNVEWKLKRDENGSTKYKYLAVKRNEVRLPDASQFECDAILQARRIRRFMRRFRYLPDGIMLALLAGWLRRGKLVLRPKGRPKTELRVRVCPGWDSSIPTYAEKRRFGEDWKDLVELNLSYSNKIESSWLSS